MLQAVLTILERSPCTHSEGINRGLVFSFFQAAEAVETSAAECLATYMSLLAV